MVSICIPTYNNLQLFKQCLNSVLIQEYKNYEIIVSDDSTNDVIKKYINTLQINNLVYSHNKPALGSPLNWNKAMQMAKGEYIKFLHHDDYFNSKYSLGKFVEALDKNKNVDFCFSWTNIYFSQNNEHFVHKQTNTQLKRLTQDASFLFFRNVIGAPSACIFRNDERLVFNKNYKWLVDVEFYIQFLQKHPLFVNIKEDLITTTHGAEGQITQSIQNDKQIVVQENLNLFANIYTHYEHSKKARLFFEEIFFQFQIKNIKELKANFVIPPSIMGFIENVFLEMNKMKTLKRLKKRILTSRYNKQIFKIERF